MDKGIDECIDEQVEKRTGFEVAKIFDKSANL